MSSKVARQLDFLAHDLATFRSGLQPGELPVDLEKMASLQGNITKIAGCFLTLLIGQISASFAISSQLLNFFEENYIHRELIIEKRKELKQ